MDIRTLKKIMKTALLKNNFYTEAFLVFKYQYKIPKTFLNLLKKYNKEYLLEKKEDFEEYIFIENEKILMLSRYKVDEYKHNYYIFVFYE